MKTSSFFAVLLALPLAAVAQNTPTATSPAKPATTAPAAAPAPAGTQQQTEVTEDLDPVTGRVIRRTTRTINVPIATAPAPATTRPAATSTTGGSVAASPATDAQVTAFLRKKTAVAALTTTGLVDAYGRFMDRVRTDRHSWSSASWDTAANVLSSLNTRYEQLRTSFTLDDKITIRSQQAEFQALRTGRQLSDQISDKL